MNVTCLDEVADILGLPNRPVEANVPLLWHWACFGVFDPIATLGVDGHRRRNDPWAKKFPRRMWVGGDVEALLPIRVHEPATQITTLREVSEKQGARGEFLLVRFSRRVEQDGRVMRIERQDIAYRAATSVPPVASEVDIDTTSASWVDQTTPTPTTLFRFSATTANSHRIHYDVDYARAEEGYPDLVVHGPLTAMLAAASASRHLGRELTRFSYRAVNPLFANQRISIIGEAEGDAVAVTAFRVDGAPAMRCTVS